MKRDGIITQRRIDAAGKPQHHAGEAVAVHIVGEADLHRVVDILRVRIEAVLVPLLAHPTLRGAEPRGERDALLPVRELHGNAAVGVHHEAGAVEHDLILSADAVEVRERQARFRDAHGGKREPFIILVELVGAAVRHEQDFRARLRKAFADVREPDVLADRHTETDAAEGKRTRQRSSREHALLVKHPVVRQFVLARPRLDLAAIEKRHRVVELAVFQEHAADEHGRAAIRRGLRHALKLRAQRRQPL